jgi:DNA-binding NtrC family response regulator
VEDEGMLAMLLEDLLEKLGCAVADTAARLREAERAAEQSDFDIAIVDINLHGESSFPLVQSLAGRGVPCVVTTGYGLMDLPADLRCVAVLEKPYRLNDLQGALQRALAVESGDH